MIMTTPTRMTAASSNTTGIRIATISFEDVPKKIEHVLVHVQSVTKRDKREWLY